MKRKKSIWMAASVTVCFLLLAVTACKKPASIASKQSRLDWNLKTTVGAYQKIGNTDPKWDEPATNALAEFAASRSQSFAPDEDWTTIIRTNCDSAVQAGCNDPMIRYLHIRFCMSSTNSPNAFADEFRKTARAMQHSSYPPIRKFYAAFWAVTQYTAANNYPSNVPPEIENLSDVFRISLKAVLDDKATPPEEVYDACHEVLEAWKGGNGIEMYYHFIEEPLFKNWPNESITWLLKGEGYIGMAWNARGGGYANTVTPEGWMNFSNDLAVADESLNRAWELNSKDERIPLQMMTVALGKGKGRDQMELWFNRAMVLNPNNYDACNSKLLYIEPKWYGSVEEMLNFGRFCVQNTNWSGRIPIILVNAHLDISQQYIDKSEQTNYWKQPEVWADIQSAYNRCFQIDPQATDLYYYYARFAYRAEDWSKLNELIPKLGSVINYDFFGGKDEFDKMVQLAKENAGKPK